MNDSFENDNKKKIVIKECVNDEEDEKCKSNE